MNGYAVFDIETTGFRLHEDSIVEIAVVHVDLDGEITGRWDTLLRPRGGEVGPTHVHGIDHTMVQGAPSFAPIFAASSPQRAPSAPEAPQPANTERLAATTATGIDDHSTA